MEFCDRSPHSHSVTTKLNSEVVSWGAHSNSELKVDSSGRGELITSDLSSLALALALRESYVYQLTNKLCRIGKLLRNYTISIIRDTQPHALTLQSTYPV